MGLLQKLKSALGFDGAESSRSTEPPETGEVDVTVEREPSTGSEDAVKGTETASADATPTESDDADTSDETDAGDLEIEETEPEPESEADAEPAADEPEAEVEPATEDESEPEADESEAEAESDSEEAPETETEPEPPSGSTDPVTEITGIGPAYAERLAGIGIETVGELAAADAADIAAETDLSESRVAGWIEQATAY